MKKKEIDVKYYEKNDLSSVIQKSMKKKYLAAKTKRITMNISELAYDEAQELVSFLLTLDNRLSQVSREKHIQKLKKMVEIWIEAHEKELLEQWENAKNNKQVAIVG